MSTYTNEQVAHLVEGSLDWETTFRMLSMPKDEARFEQYLAALAKALHSVAQPPDKSSLTPVPRSV